MLLLALHNHKEFMEECAGVLNEEWPRSLAARCHSLGKSNPCMPISLVYLDEEKNKVIGHSRLSGVQGDKTACFVESVVIKKEMRGLGLGKKLMRATEEYAESLGLTTLFLTTIDKEGFYSHIGYTYCQPIISLGCATSLLSPEKLSTLFGSQAMHTGADSKLPSKATTVGANNTDASGEQQVAPSPPPPPPISPLSLGSESQQRVHRMDPRHVKWMKKNL